MLAYIIRRLLTMIPTLLIISFITFIIIQLPPGDFFTTLQAEVAETGGGQDKEVIKRLQEVYGLDKPLIVQYVKWLAGFIRLDFGYSLEWNAPVWSVIGSKLAYTIFLGILSMIFMVIISIPIGIYSASHQYSLGDHALSAIGFVGLSIPGFLLALVWMFIAIIVFHIDAGGVMSEKMANAPWSVAKVADYLNHLWPAVVILGLASTAQLQRIMRSSLLDVLGQQYITTARAKGLPEYKVINKYGVRVAINPLISVIALEVPKIINASTLVGIVMMLPTLGPVFLRSLRSQDMYLAGTILLFSTLLLMVSNLIADIVLAWVDPRIVYT
ncbi:MAG: ABC transporter permease [Chloroflexota bacterium]|nr:MAG: ABC transporter permease [Chloroflexota bacterium]